MKSFANNLPALIGELHYEQTRLIPISYADLIELDAWVFNAERGWCIFRTLESSTVYVYERTFIKPYLQVFHVQHGFKRLPGFLSVWQGNETYPSMYFDEQLLTHADALREGMIAYLHEAFSGPEVAKYVKCFLPRAQAEASHGLMIELGFDEEPLFLETYETYPEGIVAYVIWQQTYESYYT